MYEQELEKAQNKTELEGVTFLEPESPCRSRIICRVVISILFLSIT
jgi:hypothetical protein